VGHPTHGCYPKSLGERPGSRAAKEYEGKRVIEPDGRVTQSQCRCGRDEDDELWVHCCRIITDLPQRASASAAHTASHSRSLARSQHHAWAGTHGQSEQIRQLTLGAVPVASLSAVLTSRYSSTSTCTRKPRCLSVLRR